MGKGKGDHVCDGPDEREGRAGDGQTDREQTRGAWWAPLKSRKKPVQRFRNGVTHI